MNKALIKLIRTNAPFTVEDVCKLACVEKTFIYDKRRPELTRSVLEARDASQSTPTTNAHGKAGQDQDTTSWRERALNAEALAKSLRTSIQERYARIADLTGQLYDHEVTARAHIWQMRTRGSVNCAT